MNRQLQEDLEELASNKSFFEGTENSVFFITGSTGLIGSILIKALLSYSQKNNANIKIYALCRSSEKFNSLFKDFICDDLIPVYANLLDFDSEKIDFPIDYIIHAAAITTSKDMVEHAVETLDTAYTGTKSILNLAKKAKVKSMVYISSMEVYGTTDIEL